MSTTLNIPVLDVTIIEPRLKHPTIFEKFDSLKPGEAFIIHNDHDPKPLYYQLLGERGNIFHWEYLSEGPEVWEVKISKVNQEAGETVGELVAKDFRKAQVFKRFGIDFCCGGKKSVADVCAEKGISQDELTAALDALPEQDGKEEVDYNRWDASFLADYIVNTHHNYVRDAIPALYEYTSKIARVHGNRHPELVEIAKHFIEVANELEAHMPKEESVLFPYIRRIEAAKKEGKKMERPAFGTIQNPINMMELEHENAGSSMEAIRTLSNDFSLPADACATYTVAFKKLQEFEEDLHRHIHLENNILFPKALELEKEVLA